MDPSVAPVPNYSHEFTESPANRMHLAPKEDQLIQTRYIHLTWCFHTGIEPVLLMYLIGSDVILHGLP